MFTKISDIIITITLIDLVIKLALSKESIAMKTIAFMLILIFLILEKISRKLIWNIYQKFDLSKSLNY